MDVRTLKGIAVVTVHGGEKLGTVEDILIDTTERRVGALRVDGGGRLRKEQQFVPFESVHNVGKDAVMIPDADSVLHAFGSAGGLRPFSELTGTKVVTDSGDYIGKVATAHFDPTSGKVTEIEIDKGGLTSLFSSNRIVSAESITSFGDGIVVVPADVAGEQHG